MVVAEYVEHVSTPWQCLGPFEYSSYIHNDNDMYNYIVYCIRPIYPISTEILPLYINVQSKLKVLNILLQ